MRGVVAPGVEDGEQDETRGADEGEQDRERLEDLFAGGRVGGQAAAVTEPAVGGEREVEEDGRQDAARDEERLEIVRAHVRDVGYRRVGRHGREAALVRVDDPVQPEAQEGAEPDAARDYGQDLFGDSAR